VPEVVTVFDEHPDRARLRDDLALRERGPVCRDDVVARLREDVARDGVEPWIRRLGYILGAVVVWGALFPFEAQIQPRQPRGRRRNGDDRRGADLTFWLGFDNAHSSS
jgi:hypothetical protein